MPGTLEAFHPTQPQPPLVLKLEFVGISLLGTGALGWGPGVWLRHLIPQRGPPQLRYPSRFLSAMYGCETNLFCVPVPPTSLDVAASLNLVIGFPFS